MEPTKKPLSYNDKATCWSITIFNKGELPCREPGWKVTGQWEACPTTGKEHLQGKLNTPSVRFTQVKKAFPTAHIEIARNSKALEAYVHKEETRVATYEPPPPVPNMFQFQKTIAELWDWRAFTEGYADYNRPVMRVNLDEYALIYVDSLVADTIDDGQIAGEFIGINPMWRSSWKKFWRNIIKRHAREKENEQTQTPRNEIQEGEGSSEHQGESASSL